MKLPHFLLDDWLNSWQSKGITYDLASSTGPKWTVGELLALDSSVSTDELMNTSLFYSSVKGGPELRQTLADMVSVSPDDILIVTGASEALWLLFFDHTEPGANIVVPEPGYPPMIEIPRALGCELRSYTLKPENSFIIEPEEVMGLCDSNTRMILINTPHNPTGSVVSEDIQKTLHDFAYQRGIHYVVDEVYHPVYHGEPVNSAVHLPHATVIGDMSKSFCMGGLRTGWIVCRDAEKIRRYTDARGYFTIANTTVGEYLSEIAVKHRNEIFNRVISMAGTNLKILDRFFEEFRDIFGWVRPTGGMTAYPWMKNGDTARTFCEYMANKDVLLAPGDCFGQPSHFRLGFATSGDRFPEAIKILRKEVKEFFKKV